MTSTSTQTVLSADNLTKSFGTFTAVRGASVSVHRGEVVAIIGPNGAGKTTFFDMLPRRNTPDSGTVSIFGKDVTRMPPCRRVRLGMARSFQVISVLNTLTTIK